LRPNSVRTFGTSSLDWVRSTIVSNSRSITAPEANTSAAVLDLAQKPYGPGSGQGVCDLSEALGVAGLGEAVALLRDDDARSARCGRDVLVAVEHHLRAERRVAADLDRHMPHIGSMM
jgi:hypothetical protein